MIGKEAGGEEEIRRAEEADGEEGEVLAGRVATPAADSVDMAEA